MMFYAASVSSPGGGRGRFEDRRITPCGVWTINAKTTASADVAVYIVKAFR